MITSVLRLQPALEMICDDQPNNTLAIFIPKRADFELMAELSPILKAFHTASDAWSADKTPTMQNGIHISYNLRQHIIKLEQSESAELKEFSTNLLKWFDIYFPDCGINNKLLATAHLFHPFFKGVLIKKIGGQDRFQEVKSAVIESHPSRIKFVAEQKATPNNLFDTYQNAGFSDAELVALEMSDEGN